MEAVVLDLATTLSSGSSCYCAAVTAIPGMAMRDVAAKALSGLSFSFAAAMEIMVDLIVDADAKSCYPDSRPIALTFV